MNNNDSLKPHSGPTPFCLLQRNKQRNCKDMKKILVKTKTANFDNHAILCHFIKSIEHFFESITDGK